MTHKTSPGGVSFNVSVMMRLLMVTMMLLTGRAFGFHQQQQLPKIKVPRPLASMTPSHRFRHNHHHHYHHPELRAFSRADRGLVCVRGEDDGTGPQEGDPYDDLRPDFEFDAVTLTAIVFGLIAFNFFVVANL